MGVTADGGRRQHIQNVNEAAAVESAVAVKSASRNVFALAVCVAVATILAAVCLVAGPSAGRAYADFDPSGYTVPGVSPAGTQLNLFDYWITTQDDEDYPGSGSGYNGTTGVNEGREFQFGGNDAPYHGRVNNWTNAKGGPRMGIVEALQQQGYPYLTKSDWLGIYQPESLAYLFDPNMTESFKASYAGVQGLLQVDDQGYYYYNSNENFAQFDATSNKFNLYNAGAVKNASHSVNTSEFFPFTNNKTMQKLYAGVDENSKLVRNDAINARSQGINHYFGLTMSTRFKQLAGGQVESGGVKRDMTYEFSGDDDVWIFIDDVLVGDLGGIHDPAGIKINFATGEITYGKYLNDDGSFAGDISPTTIRAMFKAAGKEDAVAWSGENGEGNTFADNTLHRIKFYYLERGNSDSNMSLKFNLVTVPESTVSKVDQYGNPLAGVSFELYGQVWDEETQQWLDDRSGLVAEGTTDSEGSLVLGDPENNGEPISFDEIYSRGKRYTHYRLHEVNLPPGYRSGGDVLLEYHPAQGDDNTGFGGYVTTREESQWQTGASASTGVLVSAPAIVKKGIINDNGSASPGDVIDDAALRSGTMFAVVLKYTGDGTGEMTDQTKWKAVSGNALNGWKTQSATSIADIIAAAKNGAAHRFASTQKGTYEVTIDDLPGDISTYYNIIVANGGSEEDTKYTVGYYFTSGSLADATPENTSRLYIDSTTTGEVYQRQFSVNLRVPNIKNELYVQKTDANWKSLSNDQPATFSLYAADQVADGKLVDGATPFDTVTTGELTIGGRHIMDSGASFPTSDKVLPQGTYYLAEDTAPDGYKQSTQLTKVVVTAQGVYADAGAEGDDVRVLSGVGGLVPPMAGFASGVQDVDEGSASSEDDISATLRDITATLQAGTEPTYDQSLGWQYTWTLPFLRSRWT